jgi:hypothetical protein
MVMNISHAENVYIRGTFYRNKNNYVQFEFINTDRENMCYIFF